MVYKGFCCKIFPSYKFYLFKEQSWISLSEFASGADEVELTVDTGDNEWYYGLTYKKISDIAHLDDSIAYMPVRKLTYKQEKKIVYSKD